MNDLLLSVIMPTYNGAQYLPFALESIRNQNRDLMQKIEILVVDDGSTDSTIEILLDYSKDLPIKILRSHREGNWVKGLNEGLKAAKGLFCCQLHQDDAWAPDRLQILFSEMQQHPNVEIFIHNADFIDCNGIKLGRWSCPFSGRSRVIQPDIFFRKLLVQDFICINTPIFRTELINAIGLFDENFQQAADWDYWLSLFGNYPSYFINQSLSFFRIHPQSQTVQHSKNHVEYMKQLEKTLERHSGKLDSNRIEDIRILKAARFSNLVNTCLGRALHQQSIKPIFLILKESIKLSPKTMVVYIWNSRIIERVGARIRARKALRRT